MEEDVKIPEDPQIKEKLDALLKKQPAELTPHDKDFLRARRAYIGKNSRRRLSEVFSEQPEEPKKEEPKVPGPAVNPHPSEQGQSEQTDEDEE